MYFPIWPRVEPRGRRAGRAARRAQHRPQPAPELAEPAAEPNEIPARQPDLPEAPEVFLQEILRIRQENLRNRADLRNAELNPVLEPLAADEAGVLGPARDALEQRLLPAGLGEVANRHQEPGPLEPVPLPERADGIVEEPIEHEVEEVNPEPLPVPNFPRATPAKDRVLFKGTKQAQVQNSVYSQEDERKPLFRIQRMPFKITRRTQRILPETHWNSLFSRVNYGEVDEDLLAELWMEAAFQPRSPRLMIQLKNKAKRFMADWDTSLYSRMECMEMALKAVGAAMTISPIEEQVRQLLLDPEANKLMLDHEKMCKGELKAPTLRFKMRLPGQLSSSA